MDGVALLRLGELDDPEAVHPNLRPLGGGAHALPLFVDFDQLAADPPKVVRYLRKILGPDLAAHDDARGVLVAAEEPRAGVGYDALVTELASRGFWAREEPPPEPALQPPAAMAELTRSVLVAMSGRAPEAKEVAPAAASGDRADAATRYDALAADLDAAAVHLRRTAEHFRAGDVPRASAHRVAAEGHLVQVREGLDALAVLQARRSGR